MALHLSNVEFQTFPVPEAYLKIEHATITDYINQDGVKKYKAEINLNTWKDSTKTVCLFGTPITLEGLALEDLTYAKFYELIKALPGYETATNV